jgi:hypothetical protein
LNHGASNKQIRKGSQVYPPVVISVGAGTQKLSKPFGNETMVYGPDSSLLRITILRRL